MSIYMSDKDGNIRNELMYRSDIPALFQQGWDAGFQEALIPDTHPDQDRCLETYLQMVGSGMIQIDKPVARLAKFLAITAPDEDAIRAAFPEVFKEKDNA